MTMSVMDLGKLKSVTFAYGGLVRLETISATAQQPQNEA